MMAKEPDRFLADGMTLQKSQCAGCKFVKGLICLKTNENRKKKYIYNEAKCPHLQR